jgi:DNA replication protein DnaC
MSLAAAKYITKYTHKGPDRATVEIQQRNEVSEFRDSRYIAASEASWRLFEFPIHHQEPAVMSLQVHLPGQHMVVFNPNESIETVAAHAEQERTMLTAFFQLNHDDPLAQQYTYQEAPQHFVWDRRNKEWKHRQRGSTIGRLYFVSPTAGERFYLRTLLTTVKGPTSWEDLRTFDGTLYSTFHAACLARGLLQNDDEWRQCLSEASLTHVGESLRRLFSLILRHCEPSQPDILWGEFRGNLCDDLDHRLQRERDTAADIPLDEIYDFGLFLIDNDLRQHGMTLSSFPSMPSVQRDWEDRRTNPYISEQLAYNRDSELNFAEQNIPTLNDDQRLAFDKIFASAYAQDGKMFFVHGPGGTGKTFLYKTLCHRLRANGWIVLCVASSGIAALLLPGGRTAHSMFSIPVEMLSEHSSCQVEKNSKQADMFRKVRLIIWDEAVTQHRYSFIYSLYALRSY